MTETPSTRRRFVARAGMAAGAFAAATLGLPAGALGEKSRHHKHVYKLAPEGSKYHCSPSQEAQGSCFACKACHKHAHNKLFANRKAATQDRHRAHPGCRCGVKRGRRLSREKWQELFRPDGKKVSVVDKRHPRVRRILDRKH